MDKGRKLLAEAIGTFFLCFAGISAILTTQAPINSGAGLVGIALAHGLAVSIAVSMFGGISGAHINPAVTLGLVTTGRMCPFAAVFYIAAQLIGAVGATAACKWIFPAAAVTSANLGMTLPGGEWVTLPILLGTEFILTFLLMTAIYGTAIDKTGLSVKIGGFAIGLTVTADILAGGPITGASMNPARSFGPALLQGDFSFHWCYWAAPIAGAIAAALLYEHVLLDKSAEENK